jgi:hypothetical protein
MNANALATFLLSVFPLVMLGLFMAYRPGKATVVSLLIAEMFLPPGYTLPISPSWLDRETIPPLALGVLALVFARPYFRRSRPFRGIEAIFVALLISDLMTYWTNRDPVQYGPVTLPGLNAKDLLGDVMRSLVNPWLLFFLGRTLFKTSRDLRALCRMLVIGAVVYTPFVLYELRMSPSLNQWLYGYQASQFDMALRWGGYRPMVFFIDGLHLASFLLASTVTALSMARTRTRLGGVSMRAVSLYLLAILVACKSTGAIAYAALLIPLVSFMAPKRALLFSAVLAVFFLVYPIIRIADLLPVDQISSSFTDLSAERAGSLSYRFNMESGMLKLTQERPMSGWGGWDRNFVHDPVSGDIRSVPDGLVIIMLSSHGLVGFFAYFLVFICTIVRARKLIPKIASRDDRLLLSALCVNCAVILFDLILNSAFFPIFIVMFGALYGLPSGILAEEAEAATTYAIDDDGLGGLAEAYP